jgi:hypothetical protein
MTDTGDKGRLKDDACDGNWRNKGHPRGHSNSAYTHEGIRR